MKTLQLKRIERVQKLLRQENQPSALLLSSAPVRIRSHDTAYKYRQSSNFFYLTGSTAPDLLLLIRSDDEPPVLYAPPVDPVKELWEGPAPNARALARTIGATFIEMKTTPLLEVTAKLDGIEQLFFQHDPESLSAGVAQSLVGRPAFDRPRLPRLFADANSLISRLRLYKERAEIDAILEAAELTADAMREALVFVSPKHREFQVAASIDWWFAMQGAEPAFQTIVATGPSAATLHHHQLDRVLRAGELALIDCGAELNMYAADITRTIPVGGKCEGALRELYTIVLEAQHAAIGKIAAGVRVETVYNAAARALTQGLLDMGVLRGTLSNLLTKKAYKPYFPHGILHSLGIDVHDIGNLRNNNNVTLEEGMVVTVEPGLYFRKPTKHTPACGIRIEDDVVVTRRGCRILTTSFPKELDQLEELVERARMLAL